MRRSAPLQAVACVLAALALGALPGCADVALLRSAPRSTGRARGSPSPRPRPTRAPRRPSGSRRRTAPASGSRSSRRAPIVEEPLAFTELHLVFDNPEDRVLEGTFQHHAARGRRAQPLRDEDRRGRGRRARSSRSRPRARPTRTSSTAGRIRRCSSRRRATSSRARVFPIPARGRKELIVSYSQELDGRRARTCCRCAGCPSSGGSTVVGHAARAERSPSRALRGDGVHADRGLRGSTARRSAAGAGLRSGNLVLARVPPDPRGASPIRSRPTLVLVDTSASRALGFEEQLRLVGAARAAHRRDARGPEATLAVGVLRPDGGADLRGRGRARSASARSGASRDAAGVRRVEPRARARLGRGDGRRRGGYKRVILVGDGVATAGDDRRAARSRRGAATLAAAGVERLDAIAVGGIRDDGRRCKKLATAGLARDGVVADGALDAGGARAPARRGRRARGSPVKVEGARWSWPERARRRAGRATRCSSTRRCPTGTPVRVRVGGVDGAGARSDARGAAAARARVGEGQDREPARRRAGRRGAEGPDDRARRSSRSRPRTACSRPYTALLVLETDARLRALRARPQGARGHPDGRRRAARGRAARSAPARRATRSRARGRSRAGRGPRPSGAPPCAAPARPRRRCAATAAAAARRASPAGDPPSARGNMWGADDRRLLRRGRPRALRRRRGRRRARRGHRPRQRRHRRPRRRARGTGQGFGSGHGRLGGAHATAPPQRAHGRDAGERARCRPRSSSASCGRTSAASAPATRTACAGTRASRGRVSVRFVIEHDGSVRSRAPPTARTRSAPALGRVRRARVRRGSASPRPRAARVTVDLPHRLRPRRRRDRVAAGRTVTPPSAAPRPPRGAFSPRPTSRPSPPPDGQPYTGRFKTVMDLLGAGGAKARDRDARSRGTTRRPAT